MSEIHIKVTLEGRVFEATRYLSDDRSTEYAVQALFKQAELLAQRLSPPKPKPKLTWRYKLMSALRRLLA